MAGQGLNIELWGLAFVFKLLRFVYVSRFLFAAARVPCSSPSATIVDGGGNDDDSDDAIVDDTPHIKQVRLFLNSYHHGPPQRALFHVLPSSPNHCLSCLEAHFFST